MQHAGGAPQPPPHVRRGAVLRQQGQLEGPQLPCSFTHVRTAAQSAVRIPAHCVLQLLLCTNDALVAGSYLSGALLYILGLTGFPGLRGRNVLADGIFSPLDRWPQVMAVCGRRLALCSRRRVAIMQRMYLCQLVAVIMFLRHCKSGALHVDSSNGASLPSGCRTIISRVCFP